MEIRCPICGERYSEYTRMCNRCYFTHLTKVFCSESEKEKWYSDIVIPFQRYFNEVVEMKKFISTYDIDLLELEENYYKAKTDNSELKSIIEEQRKRIHSLSGEIVELTHQLNISNTRIEYLNQQLKEKNNKEDNDYIGKIIKYGRYKGKEIEWIVVRKDKNNILVLKKKCHMNWPFHYNNENLVEWNESQLSHWLTGFYEYSFSAKEKMHILDYENGKIFLLDEFEYNQIRNICEKFKVNHDWWLCTAVNKGEPLIAVVDDMTGTIKYARATDNSVWVRPAMWIRI